jgi:hypothetical protein
LTMLSKLGMSCRKEAAMTKICMNPQKKCFIKGTANTEATTKALKVSPEIEGGA